MTRIGNDALVWDKNGQLTARAAAMGFNYNWDGKLRQAAWGDDYLKIKYDPDGNRIYREAKVGQTTAKRKYIVDVAAGLPVILLELDPDNSNSVRKTYVYAQDRIIFQHDGDFNAARYFYLHDRLGSVRQVIDVNASVRHLYTYGPFGKKLESDPDPATLANPFQFAGQYFDEEIGQLHLRERQYDPHLQRLTAIDPINGNFTEPLTLHQYLYCLNDPLNRTDLTGEAPSNLTETNATITIGSGMVTAGGSAAVTQLQNIQEFVRAVGTRSWVYGQTVYNATLGKISYSAWARQMNALGNQVHHIVGKGWGNEQAFGRATLNSFNNLIAMDPASHEKITRFFNSGWRVHEFMMKKPKTFKGFSTLQEYVASRDFSDQIRWGQAILYELAANGTLSNFDPFLYGLLK